MVQTSKNWRSVLPNLITSFRGVCGVVILGIVMVYGDDYWAFWLFIAAISTDLIDGWVARVIGGTSELGAFLDPLADKLLLSFSWLTLLLSGWAPWWLAGTMIFRDIAVGAVYFYARGRGWVFTSNRLGQLMVCFEGVAVPVLLYRQPLLDIHWPSVGLAIEFISLFFAAASAIQYVVDGPQKAKIGPR